MVPEIIKRIKWTIRLMKVRKQLLKKEENQFTEGKLQIVQFLLFLRVHFLLDYLQRSRSLGALDFQKSNDQYSSSSLSLV